MSAKYRFPGGTAEEIHLTLPSNVKHTLGGSTNTPKWGWQWLVKRVGMVDYLPFKQVLGNDGKVDELASAKVAWAVLADFLGADFQELEEIK